MNQLLGDRFILWKQYNYFVNKGHNILKLINEKLISLKKIKVFILLINWNYLERKTELLMKNFTATQSLFLQHNLFYIKSSSSVSP